MSKPIVHKTCGGLLFYYDVELMTGTVLTADKAKDRNGNAMKAGDLLWPELPRCPHCGEELRYWTNMVTGNEP